jgi:hypothetical protein
MKKETKCKKCKGDYIYATIHGLPRVYVQDEGEWVLDPDHSDDLSYYKPRKIIFSCEECGHQWQEARTSLELQENDGP